MPFPVPKLKWSMTPRVLAEPPQRVNVTSRDVNDVNVVPNARSISRGVVVAKHRQFFPASNEHLENVWHQAIRNAAGILAKLAALVRADWIKVPQKRNLPRSVGAVSVPEHLLHRVLCLSVRVGDARAYRTIFSDGRRRATVDRARARENKFIAIVRLHNAKKSDGAPNVVVVVFERLANGLANCLVRSKVYARFDGSTFALASSKYAIEGRLIANIHLMKGYLFIRRIDHAAQPREGTRI